MAGELERWAARGISLAAGEEGDVDRACREYVRRLADGGWLRYVVPKEHGRVYDHLGVRSLCLARETLARVSGLADFAFAMQGLGTGSQLAALAANPAAAAEPAACAADCVSSPAIAVAMNDQGGSAADLQDVAGASRAQF